MSDNREQTNDGNEPSQSEYRKAQITEEFVRKLIKRGLLTCREGTRREENNISDRDFMEKKGKLYSRYEGECSGVKEYLYSIATTEDLRRRSDKLCGIIDEALDIAKNFFLWNKFALGNCSIKFYDLKPKWFSATEGFFSQVKQDLAKKPAETELGPAPEQEKEKAKTGPFTWLKNHPHSYSLQGSVVCLIICLVVGLFKPQWRNWFWGAAALPLFVLILSLLGGPGKNE